MSLKTRIEELMHEERPPLTQRAFAARIGVTQGAVAGWLAGTEPYPRHINAICAEFKVRRDWLVYGEGPKRAIKLRLQEPPPEYESIEKKITFIEQAGTPEQLQMVDDFLDSVCRQLGYPHAKARRRK